MKIAPMVRNNIFLNAHPEGCAVETSNLIARARANRWINAVRSNAKAGPKAVLIIGCSTGYGLASRIEAAFAYGSPTVGFSYEREPGPSKTATPGWYANRAFDAAAAADGLPALTYNIDAFSKEAKAQAATAAKALGVRYDLVIYSLASPVRADPETGYVWRSIIKPIGKPYAGKTVDVFSNRLSDALIQPAEGKEIEETVKVMGGEDWAMWIDALAESDSLSDGAVTIAYSYLGPSLSWPIYRDGTIGKAKADLEVTAASLSRRHMKLGLAAYVSINKALVTRASAVIPVIPLYVSALFRTMKDRGIHEDCMDQIGRLFRDRLYRQDGGPIPLDTEGRIRIDELEMGASVQKEVMDRLSGINEENLLKLADIEGFRTDFLRAHGFAVPGVDYDADVDPLK